MNRLIYLLVIVQSLTTLTYGQEIKNLEAKWYTQRIKIKSDKDLKVYKVETKRNFEIKNEGKITHWNQIEETVSADLVVNSDTLTDIAYSEAIIKGDTVDILIFQLDESHDHNFQIKIIKNKCYVYYDFSTPMDDGDRRIKTIDFDLRLNTDSFSKGKEIRGYIDYKGKCTKYCDLLTWEEYNIKGSFKVILQ